MTIGTIVALVFASCLVAVQFLAASLQPQPYMDEIFHIPQAQQYCRGNLTAWDPMITTPAGLYLYAVQMLLPLSLVLGGPLEQWCTTTALR
jgi:alpha-1,2-glucosyltransferase